MKNTKLKGVTLYTKDDQLPTRFTNEGIGRLFEGETYKVLGPCHVEATTRNGVDINAWDGILLETKGGKQFPVSVGVLLNIGFINEGTLQESVWKVVRTKVSPIFEDAKSLSEYKKFIKVVSTEMMSVQKFNSEDRVEKSFYGFAKLDSMPS